MEEEKDLKEQEQKTNESLLKDQFARLSADFENYKKRITKERANWEQAAKSVVIEEILEIVKDIDLAYEQLQKAPAELKNWLVGIELIYKSFQKFLTTQGVQEVPTKEFDPELHEALNKVPATDEFPSGSIVTVYEKGYTLNGTLIKAAKVSVAD